MISLITCSRNYELFLAFSDSVRKTIGVEFEIIRIDNKDSEATIFEAYNKGLKQSKFEIVVFVHEDVIFHSQDWGQKIIYLFKEFTNLGVIGVAGGLYKTKAPSAWWDVDTKSLVINLIQHYNDKPKKHIDIGWIGDEKYKEVAIIDGVFMATKKSLNLDFDNELPGFHCYDLNLCVAAASRKKKIIVIREILIEHLSSGSINKDWVYITHLFHKKYGHSLPIKIKNYNYSFEIKNLELFINTALNFRLSRIATIYWLKLLLIKPFSEFHYHFFKRALVSNGLSYQHLKKLFVK